MRIYLSLALIVLTVSQAYSQAPIPALNFTSSSPNGTAVNSTRGFVFSVLNGVTVSQLGVYDQGADGLAESHAVGIWNSSGTLLASATVPSGVVAPLDVNNLFRIVNISPVFLPAGTNYRVGAYFDAGSADAQATLISGITTAPNISYVTGAINNDNALTSLSFPLNNTTNPDGLVGGSFQVVPEPTTWALIGILTTAGVSRVIVRRKRANEFARQVVQPKTKSKG